MRYVVLLSLLFSSGCKRLNIGSPKQRSRAEPQPQEWTLADFFIANGEHLITYSFWMLIAAALIWKFAGKEWGQLAATIALATLGLGIVSVLLAPYIEPIFWVIVALTLLVGGFIIKKNWKRLLFMAEGKTGLDFIPGGPVDNKNSDHA